MFCYATLLNFFALAWMGGVSSRTSCPLRIRRSVGTFLVHGELWRLFWRVSLRRGIFRDLYTIERSRTSSYAGLRDEDEHLIKKCIFLHF